MIEFENNGLPTPQQSRHVLHVAQATERLEADPNNLVPRLLRGRIERPPLREVLKEEPWHRVALTLFAAGLSQKEVAECCSRSLPTVGTLKRQPWFQEALVKLVEERTGSRDILELMKAECLGALQVQLDIMHNEKASPSVRANVANSILDRVYGKATQKVEVSGGIKSGDPVAEVEELKRQNAEHRKSLGLEE